MASATTPIALWKVLEEEFVALGGQLPQEYLDLRERVIGVVVENENDAVRQERENAAILRSLLQLIHDKSAAASKGEGEGEGQGARAALCLSGGGIRSATFNLGLVQRLAQWRLLDQFDFISTVSGGGYLGGWLSAWIHRNPDGVHGVMRALQPAEANKTQSTRDPIDPEPPPLRHLRTFSRYLSPRIGLLSADTWTLATIYIRNLILNWLVLVPLLLASLAIPRFFVTFVALDPLRKASKVMGAGSQSVRMLLATLGMLAAAWAFGYAGLHQPSAVRNRMMRRGGAGGGGGGGGAGGGNAGDGDASGGGGAGGVTPEKPRKASAGQRSFLLFCWTPLLISAAALSTYWAWAGGWEKGSWTSAIAFGILLAFIGWVLCLVRGRELEKVWELPSILACGTVAGLALMGSAALLRSIWPPAPVPAAASAALGLNAAIYVCLSFPLVLMSFALAGTLYVGLVSRFRSTHDEDREWWARCGAWILIAVVAWTAGSILILLGPGSLMYAARQSRTAVASLGGISGIVTLVLGKSAITPATRKNRESSTWTTLLAQGALLLAAPVFAGFLVVVGSYVTTRLLGLCRPEISFRNPEDHFRVLAESSPVLLFTWTVALALFGLLMSWLINLNKFSLHGMYRDRLVRAYLGASRPEQRLPDPFTGFDPADNVSMYLLRPEMLRHADPRNLGIIEELATAAKAEAAKSLALILPSASRVPACTTASASEGARCLLGLLTKEAAATLAQETPLDYWEVQSVLDELNRIILEGDLSACAPLAKTCDPEQLASCKAHQNVPLTNRLILDAAFAPKIVPLTAEQRVSEKPLHVINIALNLVSGDDPAWQERKAESFTVSALHCGSAELGYRRSRVYGGPRGINLGTAVTISGAAVSPNMGYHSSRALAFLLTLFNVRLGWWLGNPGDAGDNSFTLPCPRVGIFSLAAEAFGLTDSDHKYVYLSDGGHFENLGLYEMVRRRCRFIVVGDAGCDPGCKFEDLGNALRKIRVDLGISISFKGRIPIYGRDDKHKPVDADCCRYCAIATIDYQSMDGPGAANGKLLYIKPTFYSREPADVFNYASQVSEFPHESTADQFFSESQFESYRELGYYIMGQAWQGADAPGRLADLFRDTAERASEESSMSGRPQNDQRGWLRSFNVHLVIDEVVQAGFSEVSGLPSSSSARGHSGKVSARRKYSNITLKRGITNSKDLWDWLQEAKSDAGPPKKSLTICLVDECGSEVKRWFVADARPTKWSGPPFNAKGSESAIETLELRCDGIRPA